MQPNTKQHRFGECSILLSPPYKDIGYHMSISHPDRYPTWDEIRGAWYSLVPNANNRVGAMILPKKKDYVNICKNCFHVHEMRGKSS